MTTANRRVLVADDDLDVRTLVRTLLERAGHEVVEAADGRECLRAVYERHPSLVVLDVGMPALDRWQTLERIREVADVPVLLLTAHGGSSTGVRGLRAGADDYVSKPFGRQELLARVDALLRRARGGPADVRGYVDDLLEIDFTQRSVVANGLKVDLTPLEFRLLAAFVQHAGQLLSHRQLRELAWGDHDPHSRDQVKLYVGHLRRKLDSAIRTGAPIETVRGFGYRYVSGRPRSSA
jgi:DNA-binding response OmpR family regulator